MKILKCPKCSGRAYRLYRRIAKRWETTGYVDCEKCGVNK